MKINITLDLAINLKGLESFNIKVKTPVENKIEITSVTPDKASIPAAEQSAVPVKQATIPVKKITSPQEDNEKDKKSGCTLS